MGSTFTALLLALANTITASPSISFPINSQVPPVARISKPFQFTFSASTFTSSTPVLQYSISDSPAWLQIDSAGRSLFGTPSIKDEGPVVFHLIATDDTGAASSPVTLIVSAAQGPGLGIIASQQLPAFGTFSAPESLLLYPSAPLSLAFRPDTFINIDKETVYYALCTDHTPLPSWVKFDASRLSFTGTAPDFTSPTELPQYFGIEITASDVDGFSGATTSFQIIIESHQLAFDQEIVPLNVSPGKPVNFSGLLNNLTVDGVPVRNTDIKQVLAETPEWLSLDTQSLTVSGTPPASVVSQNISIQVMDVHSNTANTTLLISVNTSSKLFQNTIGVLTATIGSDFSYTINSSIVTGSDIQVSLDLGNTSSWLSYDSTTRTLYGNVPTDLDAQQDQLIITASRGSQSESQSFMILLLQRISTTEIGATNAVTLTATTMPTPSTTSTTQPFSTGDNGSGSRRGRIVAGVIISILAILGMGLLLLCLARRRRQRNSNGGYLGASRRQISHPIFRDRFAEQDDHAEVLEKPTLGHKRLPSKPPKIDIHNLETVGENQQQSQARLTRASNDEMDKVPKRDSWQNVRRYLGIPPVMSGALRPTSRNGSEYSFADEGDSPLQKPDIVYKPKGYPSSVRRGSRVMASSSTKDCSCQSRRYSDTSFASHSATFSNRTSGLGHGKGGFDHQIPALPNFGHVGRSWKNTYWDNCTKHMTSPTPGPRSVGSIFQSFPRPPTSHTLGRSEVIHEDIDASPEPTRSTIRPVNFVSEREKFFHKRRCRNRSRNRSNPLFSAGPSSRKSTQIGYAPSATSSHIEYSLAEQENSTTNATFKPLPPSSASPSLRPSPLFCEPKPKSPSRFGTPFKLLRLQSSKSSLASRFESANESETPSEFGSEDLLEEKEGDEEVDGGRGRLATIPNPLRMHGSAEARSGAAEDLEGNVDAHGVGQEGESNGPRGADAGSNKEMRMVLGDRSKRPVSVEAEGDLRRGRMVGQSMKGDVAFL
ncbi:MAG: hypothetical protein Q9187_002229 [Circinaria calcarea]